MEDIFSLLTGYTQDSLALVKSPPDSATNITHLMDKYINTNECQYVDNDKGTHKGIGLQDSTLLARLPWLTQWEDLFKPVKPVKVF